VSLGLLRAYTSPPPAVIEDVGTIDVARVPGPAAAINGVGSTLESNAHIGLVSAYGTACTLTTTLVTVDSA
jgi:hypothetical protein